MGNHGLPPKNWLNNNWNARFWGEHHLWHAGTNQSNIFLRLDGVSVTEFLAASPTFYWSVEKYDIRSRKNGDSSHSSIRNTPKNWSNLKKKWKKTIGQLVGWIPIVGWIWKHPWLQSENTHGWIPNQASSITPVNRWKPGLVTFTGCELEHGDSVRGFRHQTWWFSIVLWLFTI